MSRAVPVVRSSLRLGVVAAALALGLALPAGVARGQFGYGGYGGYGFGFNYRPQETEFINQKSLLNASRATMGPVQNNAYANNPNAYVNHLHGDGYLDKYDVGTRRTIEASIGRYSDGPPPQLTSRQPTPRPAAPAPTQAPGAPLIPLSSFFDRYQKLVWPDGAPTYGMLGGKRSVSDQATSVVLSDYNAKGLASMAEVTDARAKLIDYGRPALDYLRNNATPRIADGFHLFLLSLYESLAQAATVPKTATGAPPKP